MKLSFSRTTSPLLVNERLLSQKARETERTRKVAIGFVLIGGNITRVFVLNFAIHVAFAPVANRIQRGPALSFALKHIFSLSLTSVLAGYRC